MAARQRNEYILKTGVAGREIRKLSIRLPQAVEQGWQRDVRLGDRERIHSILFTHALNCGKVHQAR